jgi:DNA-binding winged helix-turn-helix (wHTH) protein
MQFHFSDHVLDAGLRELTRAGEAIAVEPQVFDLSDLPGREPRPRRY